MFFSNYLSLLLKNDRHLSEIVKGSAVAFIMKLLAAGLGFYMNVIIARYLGASEAGIFFLSFTIITITATIGRVGLDNTLIRFIAAAHSENKWKSINYIYRFGVLVSLVISFFLSLFLWVLSDYIAINIFEKPNLISPIKTLTIAVPFLALFTLHANVFQGLKKIPQSLFLLSLATPLFFVILMYFFPVKSAISGSYYYLFASVITLLCGILLWWTNKNARIGIEGIDIKSIIHSCFPLLIVQILNIFNTQAGQLFLGAWSSSFDVAVFNAAQKTAMLTSFVLVAVNSISAPKFSAMHQQGDHSALAKLAVQSAQLMTALALPALLIMVFFPHFLLGLFGDEFINGALILIILAIGQFINVATGSVGYLLMMTGNEKVLRNNTFISAFISIALGFWLIPLYGLMGAAISTAVTVATANLLSCWRVYQKLGFWTLPFTKPLHLFIVSILLSILITYVVLAAHNIPIFSAYSYFLKLIPSFIPSTN